MKIQVNDEVEYLGMKATVARIHSDDANQYYSLVFPNYTIKRRRTDIGFEEYQIYNPITATISVNKTHLIYFIKRNELYV